jgi:hypothetical protein
MMPSLPKQQPTGIDHWQDSMIYLVYNACSVVTMPAGSRPHGLSTARGIFRRL